MQNKNGKGKGKLPQEDGLKRGSHDTQSQPLENADALLDHRLRSMLAEAEAAPPDDFFDRIEAQLRPASVWNRISQKSGAFYGYGAAAVMLLALLSGVLWHYQRSDTSHRSSRALAKTAITAPLTKPEDAATQTVMPHPLTALPESLQAVILSDTGRQKEAPAEDIARATGKTRPEATVATTAPPASVTTVADRKGRGLSQQQTAALSSVSSSKQPSVQASKQSRDAAAAVASASVSASLPASKTDKQQQVAVVAPQQRLPAKDPLPAGMASVKTPAQQTALAASGLAQANPKVPKASKQQVTAAANDDNAGVQNTGGDQLVVNSVQPENRRPRKKGFFKGIFKQVKDRVDEISESVVDEQADKTTYSVGFIAVTAYK